MDEPKAIAQMFADFFDDKVRKLAKLDLNPVPNLHLHKPRTPIFSMEDLTTGLKKVKNKKCYGMDGIPLRVAKDFCTLYPARP